MSMGPASVASQKKIQLENQRSLLNLASMKCKEQLGRRTKKYFHVIEVDFPEFFPELWKKILSQKRDITWEF